MSNIFLITFQFSQKEICEVKKLIYTFGVASGTKTFRNLLIINKTASKTDLWRHLSSHVSHNNTLRQLTHYSMNFSRDPPISTVEKDEFYLHIFLPFYAYIFIIPTVFNVMIKLNVISFFSR